MIPKGGVCLTALVLGEAELNAVAPGQPLLRRLLVRLIRRVASPVEWLLGTAHGMADANVTVAHLDAEELGQQRRRRLLVG